MQKTKIKLVLMIKYLIAYVCKDIFDEVMLILNSLIRVESPKSFLKWMSSH